MLDFLAEQKLLEAVSRGELDADARALRKLALLRAKIEARYYEKAIAKLGR